jgi:membrane-bound lytic murein transglycosylase D
VNNSLISSERVRVSQRRPRCSNLALAFMLPIFGCLCGAVQAQTETGTGTETETETKTSTPAQESVSPFEHPAALERDIRFWIRVYTEVTTDGGLLHDDWNLGVVYEVLRFDPGDSPAQREHQVTLAKARYAALLRRFAAGDTENLTTHERRILDAFGEKTTAAEFRDAIQGVRFQLGQADRFREGLIRSQLFEKNISKVLAQRGVPAEIGALPHVESSFNPAAYSRVGAAGLWQFMPSTARRYMRVDGLVDERLDPYTATEAAANLMLYNYRLVGTWPLAVTAYNHGPGGLRRAQDELGTSDIAVIVKRYQGSTFGFASRNFYVAFLAALEVDRNAEKYFGPMQHLPDTQSTVVEVPDYVPIDALAKAFKVDMGALQVLNPALRPPIWNGSRFVPRGYGLRLPGAQPSSVVADAWARLPPAQRYLAQRNDGTHKMRRGETLASVAAASGVPLSRLLAANNWAAAHETSRGEAVRIPLPSSRAAATTPALAATEAPASAVIPAAPAATAAPVTALPPAATAPTATLASVSTPALPPTATSPPPPREPVSERQAESAALLPAAAPSGSGDATDYGVAADNTVIVQPGETLGHFADWAKVPSESLRTLNKLHKSAMVTVGHKVKLDLSKVSAEEFASARRDYHRHLQDEFFATHKIAETENYAVKRGDSLWIIAHQHGDLPVWLISQYNPDVDLADMRPGTTITLPRIAAINRQ